MSRKYLEEILIALSLSNLLYIQVWRRLIFPHTHFYNLKSLPTQFDYFAAPLGIVLLAGTLFGSFWVLRRVFQKRLALFTNACILICIFLIANGFRVSFYYTYKQLLIDYVGGLGIRLLILAVGLLCISAIFLLRKRIFSFIRVVALIFFPFVFITFSQSIISGLYSIDKSIKIDSQRDSARESGQRENGLGSRVVWIIFDEMDFQIAFGKSPSDTNLETFEKLKTQSIFADNAFSPAIDTMESIPSLFTGRKVIESTVVGHREILLQFEKNNKKERFSETETIFSEVKRRGGRSALAGWYHPYCELLKSDLSRCHWEGYLHSLNFESPSTSLLQALKRDIWILAQSLPFYYRLTKMAENKNDLYITRHNRLLNRALDFAQDPNMDLVFIHLPIPHSPFSYDRKTNQFAQSHSYTDNLVLTDQVLREIRTAMRKSGLWDESSVIVSSDHPLREKEKYLTPQEKLGIKLGNDRDLRIPFIVKLKNQNKPSYFNKEINSLLTHDLILALLESKVETSEDAQIWLQKSINGK